MMTKEKYIRQVCRRLRLPREIKESVLADLAESFDAGRDHGETQEEILARLGSPRTFAEDVMRNTELTHRQRRCLWWERVLRIAMIVLAALALAAGVCAGLRFLPEAVPQSGMIIGYADGPTEIYVGNPADPLWIFFGVSLAAAAMLLGVWVYVRHQLNR